MSEPVTLVRIATVGHAGLSVFTEEELRELSVKMAGKSCPFLNEYREKIGTVRNFRIEDKSIVGEIHLDPGCEMPSTPGTAGTLGLLT